MIILRVDRGPDAGWLLSQIKATITRCPGDLDVEVRAGNSRLRLGPAWRTDGSPACMAALSEFGEVLTC